jgi:hypothetical protein
MTKLEHDPAPLSMVRRLSCQATIPRFANPRSYQGNAQCNRMHPAGEFFQQTVPRRVSVSTIRQIFEQCCQILNSREAIMPLAPAALGGEHFGRRNLHFNGSPKKVEEDPNPFFRREQASNHDLQSQERPINNLNRLANFDGRIDGHDFFCTHARLKPDYNVFRQGRQVIAKVDDSPDAVRGFDSAMLFRIHKFREQITGKHRFYEPDWPPVGHLAEAQSRRETLDAELTPESDGSQMLPLRLRL